jgi:hypothetical protein
MYFLLNGDEFEFFQHRSKFIWSLTLKLVRLIEVHPN